MSCFYCEKDERLLALMTPLTECSATRFLRNSDRIIEKK